MTAEIDIDLIRKKLNEEKIKLWLPPYTLDGHDVGVYPQKLLETFCTDLHLTKEVLIDRFEELRCHALEKLAARNKFKETGVAILKMKILGDKQPERPSSLNFETALSISGEDLRTQVASKINVSPGQVKLITQGRIVQGQLTLSDQKIQNNSCLMVLVHKGTSPEQEHIDQLHQTRCDAELLSNMDIDDPMNSNTGHLQIADQSGQVLKLPVQERKALTIAMTLHEKSRSAMKQKKYEVAIAILLEADSEFKQCTAEILDLVDNYALLNLDIVWCYLSLRSMAHLPDAERRLKTCQACFDKSYGPNLERLQALKGDKTKERALFARLHLLQGVVAFHNGNATSAKNMLSKVRDELSMLKVDDDKLCQMLGMGYSSTEARLALRASGGSIEGAVHNIVVRREEQALIRKREREERRKKAEQQKLGKTLDGQWVNVNFHERLMNMGYASWEAQQALQNSQNNISLAVQILQEQRHLLEPEVDEAAIAKMVSLGFNGNLAKRALQQAKGNVETALVHLFSENLTENGGIFQAEESSASEEAASVAKALRDAAKDAVDRLAENIPEDEEDHLDLSMEEEEAFLQEYWALLESLTSSHSH